MDAHRKAFSLNFLLFFFFLFVSSPNCPLKKDKKGIFFLPKFLLQNEVGFVRVENL